jgi:hypothetical protein
MAEATLCKELGGDEKIRKMAASLVDNHAKSPVIEARYGSSNPEQRDFGGHSGRPMVRCIYVMGFQHGRRERRRFVSTFGRDAGARTLSCHELPPD